MAEDFRKLLKEDFRNQETGERWFEDLDISSVFFLSIQASALHGCSPAALLDDLSNYEGFQVTIQIKHGVHAHGKKGALQLLLDKSWWPLFVDDSPILHVAENVPVAVVQQIFEDLSAAVTEHPEVSPKKNCGCASLTPC